MPLVVVFRVLPPAAGMRQARAARRRRSQASRLSATVRRILAIFCPWAAGPDFFALGLLIGGVLAAPIYSVNPQMGSNLIIVVFAVVVIGGMGSILGAIITGYMLGVVEGLTKVFYPEASNIVIFVIMAIVLILRPAGLFGKDA